MKPIIVIAGTTASGKSDLALELAKKINGYVINGDSRQIYKEFKIATAQPVPDKIKKDGTWIIDGIEHFLYGFVSIKSDYNIFKYQNDVKKILKKNKTCCDCEAKSTVSKFAASLRLPTNLIS